MNRETLDVLKRALKERILSICKFLYSQGHRQGNYWRVGDVYGRPGNSFGILLAGNRRGMGIEFNTNEKFDILGMWQAARGVDFLGALEEAEDFLATEPCGFDEHRQPTLQPDVPRSLLVPIPESIAAEYNEGASYLCAHPEWLNWLACSRGWHPAFVEALAREAKVSVPFINGQRSVAFPVIALNPPGEQMWLGYHARLIASGRRNWLYRPYLAAHGISVPSVPLIIGDIRAAAVLLIAEGQWDAYSVVHALGWWSDGQLKIPKTVAVIAIRGAGSWTQLFRFYQSYWNRASVAVMLPQNDAAAEKWWTQANGESFFDCLKIMCRQAVLLRIRGHKDWNDAWSAHDLTQFNELRHLINNLTTLL